MTKALRLTPANEAILADVVLMLDDGVLDFVRIANNLPDHTPPETKALIEAAAGRELRALRVIEALIDGKHDKANRILSEWRAERVRAERD